MNQSNGFMVLKCVVKPDLFHTCCLRMTVTYCKAFTEEANRVSELLRIFEGASRRQVSREKSSVFFSINVILYNRVNICQVLLMKEADVYSKYLRLPNLLG